MKEKHEECVCGLDEQELALMAERERLFTLVDEWIEQVSEHIGREISTDGLLLDTDWFPSRPTCKNEMGK